MNKVSVYDVPTRLFHWIFALLFVVAYLIVEIYGDHSPLFPYHIFAGLTMVFLLFLRVIWGFIGTAYARFSSFNVKPADLVQYLKDVLITRTRHYLGHNPASSYAAIIMYICAVGLAITGIQMTSGSEAEVYEEVHEVLATVFLFTVIIHVGGIIIHQLKHKDSLWSSMFDGKKQEIEGKSGISVTRSLAGMVMVVLLLAWGGFLSSQYNGTTGKLQFFGTELTVAEEEHGEHSDYESDDHDEEAEEHE